GFGAVFGTPVSGALFGIEVLYLGRIEYPVFFPCLVAGIVAHLVCGVSAPVPAVHDTISALGGRTMVPVAIAFGAVFGLVALLLRETMRKLERALRSFERHPYAVALAGGVVLAAFYSVAGRDYAGLGGDVIESTLAGAAPVALGAFLWKTVAT